MAKTLAFGKVAPAIGKGMKFAIGTVASINNGGSFAIQMESAGSKVMRDITAVTVTPLGGTIAARAYGSSSGYIHVGLWNVGTAGAPVAATGVKLNFTAYGGFGSA